MKCPICGKELENGYCNTCKRVIHPLYQHNKKQSNNEVLEAEIVSEEEYQYSKQQQYSNFKQHPFFTQYTFKHNTINNSCLTGIISLGLIFFILLEFGFLEALGFAFFTAIGKVITIIYTLSSLIKGKIIPPFILDVIVWICSYSLIIWLAD